MNVCDNANISKLPILSYLFIFVKLKLFCSIDVVLYSSFSLNFCVTIILLICTSQIIDTILNFSSFSFCLKYLLFFFSFILSLLSLCYKIFKMMQFYRYVLITINYMKYLIMTTENYIYFHRLFLLLFKEYKVLLIISIVPLLSSDSNTDTIFKTNLKLSLETLFLAYFCWEDFSMSIIIVTLDNHIEISVLFNMTFDTFSTEAKMFTYI
ncbi:hypothetical protein AGLY_004277 [Aphis glycines]|uniref:Uncharacterized protein n=1 Tax=Aphis glycines TaxID=307491 RepID=A0A6G0TXM1_APHGL|nr:hypothetical protein AGLY_004277 [Aphis glycines]